MGGADCRGCGDNDGKTAEDAAVFRNQKRTAQFLHTYGPASAHLP